MMLDWFQCVISLGGARPTGKCQSNAGHIMRPDSVTQKSANSHHYHCHGKQNGSQNSVTTEEEEEIFLFPRS